MFYLFLKWGVKWGITYEHVLLFVFFRNLSFDLPKNTVYRVISGITIGYNMFDKSNGHQEGLSRTKDSNRRKENIMTTQNVTASHTHIRFRGRSNSTQERYGSVCHTMIWLIREKKESMKWPEVSLKKSHLRLRRDHFQSWVIRVFTLKQDRPLN